EDVVRPAADRVYLIAANHGQLLEKLKSAPQTPRMRSLTRAIEALLVTGENSDADVQIHLKDLSQAPASQMIATIIAAITEHPGWNECEFCKIRDGGGACPIWENRSRIRGKADDGMLHRRLTALVKLSEQNGVHFPVRQLLALIANILLGHPHAPDGLMSCS